METFLLQVFQTSLFPSLSVFAAGMRGRWIAWLFDLKGEKLLARLVSTYIGTALRSLSQQVCVCYCVCIDEYVCVSNCEEKRQFYISICRKQALEKTLIGLWDDGCTFVSIYLTGCVLYNICSPIMPTKTLEKKWGWVGERAARKKRGSREKRNKIETKRDQRGMSEAQAYR